MQVSVCIHKRAPLQVLPHLTMRLKCRVQVYEEVGHDAILNTMYSTVESIHPMQITWGVSSSLNIYLIWQSNPCDKTI